MSNRIGLMAAMLVPLMALASIHAQEIAAADPPTKEKDVGKTAEAEIQRRGAFKQELGTIQADESDAVADALAPPENDSYKWFISVVTKDGDPASEQLMKDVATDPVFRAWVHIDKPSESFMHFQHRDANDATQKSWFKGIQADLDAGPYPIIVLQPPKNGVYGPNKTIVALLHGYGGDPKASVKKLRDAITLYVRTLYKRDLIQVSDMQKARYYGHEQSEPLGAPPPFQLPPPPNNNNNVRPLVPANFPPQIDEPTSLTLDQIKLAAPDATADFYLDQLSKKPTNVDSVKLGWMIWKSEHPVAPIITPDPPEVAPAPTSSEPEVTPVTPSEKAGPDHLTCLFSGGTMLSVIAGILLIWRRLNSSHLLTDEQFQALQTALNSFTKLNVTSPARTPRPSAPE